MLNDLFPSILLNVSKFLKTEDEILLQSSIDNYKHVLSVKILKNACAAQSYICFFSRRFSLMLLNTEFWNTGQWKGCFCVGCFSYFLGDFRCLDFGLMFWGIHRHGAKAASTWVAKLTAETLLVLSKVAASHWSHEGSSKAQVLLWWKVTNVSYLCDCLPLFSTKWRLETDLPSTEYPTNIESYHIVGYFCFWNMGLWKL